MTKVYGQFCPVAKAAEILCERWTPLIVRELVYGSTHFGELRRGVPAISPALLSQRLKALEQAGVLERRDHGESGGSEYLLTRAGRDLRPVIEALGVWGRRWAGSGLEPEDLDPGLLMWDIRRRIDARAMPAKRTVLHFEMTDVAKPVRRWWLVVLRRRVDLLRRDPGQAVNLTVTTDVRTLTAVWAGEQSLHAAIRSGDILLKGPKPMVQAFSSWLGLSPFARIKRAREQAARGEPA